MNKQINSDSISNSIDDINIYSKVKSLNIYYNLLCEKSNFYMTSICELEEKFKKFKHKLYILTHKVCIHEQILNNMLPTCWVIENQKEKASNGGKAFNNKWIIYKYNTIYIDNYIDSKNKTIVLDNNIIIINTGHYQIDIAMTFVKTGNTKIRLFNITDNKVVDESLATYVSSYGLNNSVINLSVLLHLSEKTEFEVQYITQNNVDNYGLGLGTGLSDKEIFSRVRITKFY